MSRLIRMDSTGHSTLAEWTAADDTAFDEAVRAFRSQLDEGYIGVLDEGPGKATQVRELPRDAGLVILRRPIAGGEPRGRDARRAPRAQRGPLAPARQRRVDPQARGRLDRLHDRPRRAVHRGRDRAH